MRVPAVWLSAAGAAALAACGGKVIVDGSGGTGGASSSSSSSAGASSSSSSSSTTSSSTSASSSSGAGGGCPGAFPGIEAPCDQEGLSCAVPDACCSGDAVCKGGFWTFAGLPCGLPCTPACGPDGFVCSLGTLCVAYIGETTTYQCSASPCPGAVTCGCAAPLCAAEGMMCNNVQGGYKVLCD